MDALLSGGLGFVISVLSFLVLLPLIVFIHEYGHFKTARLCGVRVDAFSFGFGRELFGWTDRHGTRFKISALPLGGYVKFFGDGNAASAPQPGSDLAPAEAEEPDGQTAPTQFASRRAQLEAVLTEDEKAVCYHFKPVWQRMAVVAAGPFANFVLAFVIFAGIFGVLGRPYTAPVVGEVIEGSAAEAAGFAPLDRMLTIGGRRVDSFDAVRSRVLLSADTELVFEVERDGETLVLAATPRRETVPDPFGNESRIGLLGVRPYVEPRIGGVVPNSPAEAAGLRVGDVVTAVDGADVVSFTEVEQARAERPGETMTLTVERDGRTLDVAARIETVTPEGGEAFGYLGAAGPPAERRTYGPIGAVRAGAGEVGRILEMSGRGLARLVTGREDIRQLSGPVSIGRFAGQAVRSGFVPGTEAPLSDRLLTSGVNFLNLAALISVSIGFLNLLPVPVLDGGHLLFYAYEAVAGRPLPDWVQGAGSAVGLVLVGLLMLFVVANDVVRLF